MKRVLMVDDEEDLVWTTGRQVQRARPELAFDGVTDPREALRRIEARCPDLLITDIRMPQMSGLELLLEARRTNPQLPVIVVTAHGNAQMRTQVQRANAVQYMEKPFTFEALFEAIDRGLNRATGFSGAISLPLLPDLIQMYALSRMTGALRIARDALVGALWFDCGEIVHAACGETIGPDAFNELLGWDGGTFSMEAAAQAPMRSIQASWQELLIEGHRLLDESRRDPREADHGAHARASFAESAAQLWQDTVADAGDAQFAARAVVIEVESGRAVVVRGDGEPSAWTGVATAILDAVAGAAPGSASGSLEWVGAGAAAGAVWNARAGIALIVCEELASTMAAPRFRSAFARWSELAQTALERRVR
jgi:CheY-like chemotaxis protein